MLSAICFNLDQSKILSSGNVLNLNSITSKILAMKSKLKKEGFWKHRGKKGENASY